MEKLDKRLNLEKNQLFWVLQVSGWLGLAVLMYMSFTMTFEQTALPYLFHPFVQSVLGVVVSWPLRWVFRWSWDMKAATKLLMAVSAVILFSLAWTVLRLVVFIWMTGEEKDFLPEFALWYFPGILVFACWTALYHGFRYSRLLQEEHVNLLLANEEKHMERLGREQAERLAREAQLKMLRYQLNPHFLFNTMNAITSLVSSGKNEAACDIMDSLSSFLRNSLDGDPLRLASLDAEIDSLKNYLSIEKIRFGDRLEVEFQILQDVGAFRVPHLILQPLAENVIKHAVRPSLSTVKLTIRAHTDGEYLVIEVDNTGPDGAGKTGRDSPEDGVGLSNVRDRLRNVYGDDHQFDLKFQPDGGLCVTMRVPQSVEVQRGDRLSQVETHA